MIRIVPSIAVAVCLLYPASVRADSVTITSGSVALGSVRGNPSLAGTMIGENFMVSFRWADPSLPCPAGCRTGDVITLTSILHAPPFINPFGIPNTAENQIGRAHV